MWNHKYTEQQNELLTLYRVLHVATIGLRRLKLIIQNWSLRVWTKFNWLKIGPGDGFYKRHNEAWFGKSRICS
jgi:hypothetical protein